MTQQTQEQLIVLPLPESLVPPLVPALVRVIESPPEPGEQIPECLRIQGRALKTKREEEPLGPSALGDALGEIFAASFLEDGS